MPPPVEHREAVAFERGKRKKKARQLALLHVRGEVKCRYLDGGTQKRVLARAGSVGRRA